MNITEMKVEDLIPYINNPRKNDDAVDAVASSIAEFGFKQPIVVDKNNIVVAGHTRLKAAKKLGLKTVPVVVADDLTDAQIKAFRLADNKVAEIAEWDEDLLDLELSELGELDFGMSDFGFVDSIEETEAPPGIVTDSSFNYSEQYGVIVICENEAEQEQVYNRLTDEGYVCKVVAV